MSQLKIAEKTPEETVEIVATDEGLVAQAKWGPYTFTEPLHPDFGTWEFFQQKSYLKREIVPRLIYLVKKAKSNSLRSKYGD